MQDSHRVPLWMRLLGSAWLGRALVLAGITVFALAGYREEPAGWWPWASLALRYVAPPVVLVALIQWRIGRGDLRCPSCRKLTPFRPRPKVPPGASEPHLRCKRCGEIIWGV